MDCGGSFCDPCVEGLSCVTDSDCENGNCDNMRCRPTGVNCSDGVQNSEETDVDCGGSHCDSCSDGEGCREPSDCTSGVCEGDICQPPSCTDGTLNGTELYLDCGGPDCPGCPDGTDCEEHVDCASRYCIEEVCTASSCSDDILNGEETGADCGGPLCEPCEDGGGCREPSDCTSGVCDVQTSDGEGICAEPMCADGEQEGDGVLNGEETDVDCGGPFCDPCSDGSICTRGGDCVSGACFFEICQAATCFDGIMNSTETDVDCGGPDPECFRCRAGRLCMTPSDCASLMCVAHRCESSLCTDEILNGDETDIDCGGRSCQACSSGLSCFTGDDCISGVCFGEICQTPSCTDRVRNGDETDVDCGGPHCPACEEGEACGVDEDCASSFCTGDVCQTPTCSDDVRNGDETDVDCGGPIPGCPRCGDLDSCLLPSDCMSLVCDAGTCMLPTCTDDVQNGDETDVNCGGATCPACDVGESCAEDVDCVDTAYCEVASCTLARSCRELHVQRPTWPTDAYLIDPDASEGEVPCAVYCDMDTEGGGWTLVASRAGQTLDDKEAVCYAGLATLHPSLLGVGVSGVWQGMRASLNDTAPNSDIRFSCRRVGFDEGFDVDLIFFDVDWYWTITTGDEGDSCFNISGVTPTPPRRLDLITGTEIAAGVDWSEPMVGEEACIDPDNFVVDLDGPGVSGPDEGTSTSWGEVNVLFDPGPPEVWQVESRCGPGDSPGGAWFVWMRELP